MNRDMSFELDHTFMDRNAGETIREARPRMTTLRVPGTQTLITTQAESLGTPSVSNLLTVGDRRVPHRAPPAAGPELSGITDLFSGPSLRPLLSGVALGVALMVGLNLILKRKP